MQLLNSVVGARKKATNIVESCSTIQKQYHDGFFL
jgi:hypothetical protein